jgi:hypothetical protein
MVMIKRNIKLVKGYALPWNHLLIVTLHILKLRWIKTFWLTLIEHPQISYWHCFFPHPIRIPKVCTRKETQPNPTRDESKINNFYPNPKWKLIVDPKLKTSTKVLTSSHPKTYFPNSSLVIFETMPIGNYSQTPWIFHHFHQQLSLTYYHRLYIFNATKSQRT